MKDDCAQVGASDHGCEQQSEPGVSRVGQLQRERAPWDSRGRNAVRTDSWEGRRTGRMSTHKTGGPTHGREVNHTRGTPNFSVTGLTSGTECNKRPEEARSGQTQPSRRSSSSGSSTIGGVESAGCSCGRRIGVNR